MCLIAVMTFLGMLFAVCGWTAEPQPRIAIGFSSKFFPDIDPKDAQAAMKLWVSEVGAREQWQSESTVYTNIDVMLKDFRGGRLDMIVMSSIDYFRNDGALSGTPGFVGVRGGKIAERYVMLARADKNATSVMAMKGKKLILVQHDDLGTLFLNTTLLRLRQPEMNRFFSVVDMKPKHSQAIHTVFFGAADVCVVSERSFLLMRELNPQVAVKLTVIGTSADLIPGVAIFRKGYPQVNREKMQAVTLGLKNYVRGRQILSLLQHDDFALMRETDLAEMRRLYREYRNLKGKLL